VHVAEVRQEGAGRPGLIEAPGRRYQPAEGRCKGGVARAAAVIRVAGACVVCGVGLALDTPACHIGNPNILIEFSMSSLQSWRCNLSYEICADA
jgi:hypothetical protein